jgi:ParB-like chromosome segregation protein Spo0J
MSNTAQSNAPEFQLKPEQFNVSEKYNVRRYPGDEELEAKRIERLANVIERDGQLDAVIVTIEDGLENVIIAGHRRRRAISMLNERRTAKGQPLMTVRARLDTDGDLKRKARTSNVQREDLSPMDLALEIQTIREEHKWEGFPGAKKVADYLGIELTTVTQHEKLLTGSKEVQEKVHAGELTTQSAFDMLNVKPEAIVPVLERAQEIQEQKDRRLTPRARKRREGKGIEDGSRIEHPAVVQAIRETPNATDKPIARTRKEILETLEQFDSPAYGHPDGAVNIFIRYFIDKFAAGIGTPDTMRKKFDAMVLKAPKGTKPEKPVESKPDAKAKIKLPAKKKVASATEAKPAKKTPAKKVAKK